MEPVINKHAKPPERRPSYRTHIRALKVGHSVTFPKADIDSVRTVVSRVKAEFGGKRNFTTAKAPDGGIEVFRVKTEE